MEKKKVLFIIGTLQSGGVSKSIVSLLQAWDKERYDTSLLLCSRQGDVFSQYLPAGVNVIYDERIELAAGGIGDLGRVLRSGLTVGWKLKLFFGIAIRLVLAVFSRALAGLWIARLMPALEGDYDLIVDYGGQQQLYYMVDKLQGRRKVTFFHSDYSKWPYYYKADRRYYPRVDHIFSISQVCVDSLKKWFPDCESKISVMENISSPELIRSQADEAMDDDVRRVVDEAKARKATVLVTVAHVTRLKGIDFALEAARLMAEHGRDFVWLFVGKMIEPEWKEEVRKAGLASNMRFIGIRPNPYPYMKAADVYVLPSRFEGKSISLDEAKILCRPVVVTRFSTVNDQFADRVNASICGMNGSDLAAKIEEIIDNPELGAKYSRWLAEHVVDNSSETAKLYQLL